MKEQALTLLELNSEIKSIISEHASRSYWVTGEISELKVNMRGHCYLELVQKAEDTEQILARNRATIWAQKYRLIKAYFETTTGQMLTDGIAVMIRVSVEFHEVYGLSLNIHDIEPAYTVGEMALRKQKVIERLTEEGVIDMNKELQLRLCCQKIAVISSPTAAGFEDFMDQLENNPYEYKFYLKLFPALMQGEQAEQSMIDALDKIYSYESFFDVVVIIRGRGSQTDLNCFNNYWLAYHITQFPLPVLTGIGHEQDDSVVDRVAHTRLKTPTAVASFLIELIADQEQMLNTMALQVMERVGEGFQKESNILTDRAGRLQTSLSEKLLHYTTRMNSMNMKLHRIGLEKVGALQRDLDRNMSLLTIRAGSFSAEKHRSIQNISKLLKNSIGHKQSRIGQHQKLLEEKLQAYDPQRVLERGYSITLHEGKVVRDSKHLKENDRITTLLKRGKLESIIKSRKNGN